jgi:Ulp1 family protease
MHNTFWLLDNRNNTERKNVLNKFKANKIDIFEYDIIFVPLHINNNHWYTNNCFFMNIINLESFTKLLLF